MQACTSAHHSDVPAHAVQIQKSRRADLREDLAQLQRAHSATTGRTAELTSRLLELSGSLRTQVGLLEHLNLTPRTAPRNFAVPTTTYP